MGQRTQTNQSNDERNRSNERTNYSQVRPNKPGRKPQPKESGGVIGNLPLATMEHYIPNIREWLGKVKDPRDPERIVYSAEHLLFSALLMFLTHMKSRRQLGAESQTPNFLENLLEFSQSNEENLAHPDTMNAFLKNSRHLNFRVFCELASSN